MRALYDRTYYLRHDAQLCGLAATLALGTFFFSVWLLWRRERMFGWYAVVVLAWSLVAVNQTATSPWPFASTDAWEKANSIALLIFGTSFTMFVLTYAGRRAPRLQAALWILTACQIAVLLAAPRAMIEQIRAIAMLIPAVGFLITCLAVIVFAAVNRQIENLVLAACMAILIASGVHDMLEFIGVLIDGVYYTTISSQATILGTAFLMAWRFVSNLRQIEGFNAELTAEVAAARGVLAATLNRQHALEVANARMGERLSLANDLHDGLGGTLMTNIVVLEQMRRDARDERLLSITQEMLLAA